MSDSTKTSITLSWSKPVYDGGAPIIGYSLDMRLKSESDPEKPSEGWKRIDTRGPLVLTEFTIGQLDEKQEYEFKVSAQNQVGWGRHAYLKEAVFPKEILGKTEETPTSPHCFMGCDGMQKTLDVTSDPVSLCLFVSLLQRLQKSTWTPA